MATVTNTISKDAQRALKVAAEAEAKAITAREAADDVALAQLQAQDEAMLKARVAQASTDAEAIDPESLRTRFAEAQQTYGEAHDARKRMEALELSSRVEMARAAFIASVHPEVTGKPGTQNTSAAARHFDMPVPTIRPYVMAGAALFLAERAYLLSEPTAEDIALVEGSFDRNSRASQAQKRLKDARKRQELEAKAEAEARRAAEAEAEAERLRLELEAANGGNGNGNGGNGTDAPTDAPTDATDAEGAEVPATDADAPTDAPTASTDAPATDAPAPAPATDAPSVTDDILRTARELVKMSKAQRKNDNKAWQVTHAKLVDILTDIFPQGFQPNSK